VDGVAYTSPTVLDPSRATATLSVDQFSAVIGSSCYIFQDWYDATHDKVIAQQMTVTVAPGSGTAYLGRYRVGEWYEWPLCAF
jgi:hypothetical protein